ncbi:MAG: ATP-dependent helicase, partial [Spirochaetales bacterium]|nr:ATP-dependent helicase [Spirochaetales bacterium]
LLERENSMDAVGVQEELIRLMESADAGEILRNRFDYLMIDGYQDITPSQEKIFLKLGEKHKRICVMGDEDRSLNRMGGAAMDNLLSFPENFAPRECFTFWLETNFRSHRDIVDFKGKWLKRIPVCPSKGTVPRRFGKRIEPRRGNYPSHDGVTALLSEEEGGRHEWYQSVYDFLLAMLRSGKISDYNQTAFLFHSVTTGPVRGLIRFLEEKKIPVHSPRSDLLFEKREIRLMLGALLTIFPDWPESVKLPGSWGFSLWDYYEDCLRFFKAAVERDREKHRGLVSYLSVTAGFYSSLEKETTRTFSSLFYELIGFPLFSEFLEGPPYREGYGPGNPVNLSTLAALMVKFESLEGIGLITPENKEGHLRTLLNVFLRFLREGGLGEYEGSPETAPSGSVLFLPIRHARGREFPVVLVGSLELKPRKRYVGLEEMRKGKGLFVESEDPPEDGDLFDFWRLFYSAFSRAKNLLVLTSPAPSRYFQFPLKGLLPWYEADLEDLQVSREKPCLPAPEGPLRQVSHGPYRLSEELI